MNERILQLVYQAANGMLSYDAKGEWQLKEQEVERFTELVEQDMCEVLEALRGYSGVGIDGNPYDTVSWNAALKAVEEEIKGSWFRYR